MWCGIDFGTTNCSISLVEDRGGYYVPQAQEIAPGPLKKVMRNVVLFSKDRKHVYAGADALSQRIQYAREEQEYYFLDYYKSYLDEANLRQKLPLHEGNNVLVERTLFSERPNREELITAAGKVLCRLVDSLETPLARQIEGYVIGTPTMFSHLSRRRLIDALVDSKLLPNYRRALEAVKFVPEPVAAAMLFNPQGEEVTNLLVFDFGGGSLDLAVLECHPNEQGQLVPRAEIALGGLEMAGRHFDEKIYRELVQGDERYGEKVKFLSPYDQVLHMEQVESVKKKLSFENSVEEFIANIPFTLHRRQLENLLRPELQQVEETIFSMLDRAQINSSEVEHVIMVGGSSLIPCIQELVESIFTRAGGANQIYRPLKEDWQREEPDYEEAITAISRGLAQYQHREELEQRSFAGYSLWDGKEEKHIEVVPQSSGRTGSPYSVDLPICSEYPRLTISLFRHTVEHEFLLNIVDIPFEEGQMPMEERFEVQVHPEPDKIFPMVRLYDREKKRYLAEFLADEISEEDLYRIFHQEKSTYQVPKREVVPPDEWSWRPSPKRLQVGDVVKITTVERGRRQDHRPILVTSIRRMDDNTNLEEVESWKFSEYFINGQNFPNRDLHLLSLDKILVEDREGMVEKLEEIHRQSKIVHIIGRPNKLDKKEKDEEKHQIRLHKKGDPTGGQTPIDEEEVLSDVFKSFQRMTKTYNEMFLDLKKMKGTLRNLQEEGVVRSELELELKSLRRQVDRQRELSSKMAEIHTEVEHLQERMGRMGRVLPGEEEEGDTTLVGASRIKQLEATVAQLQEQLEEQQWNRAVQEQEENRQLATVEEKVESKLGSFQSEVESSLTKLSESYENLAPQLEWLQKEMDKFSPHLRNLKEEVDQKHEQTRRQEENLSQEVKHLEEVQTKYVNNLKREWENKVQQLNRELDRQKERVTQYNEQLEMLTYDSLSKVDTRVLSLQGKFQKYKKRGILVVLAIVFFFVLLFSTVGGLIFLLHQELENQRLVASGNLALSVQDYENAEKFFKQTTTNIFGLGVPPKQRTRLIALAQAGRFMETGNQLLSDGKFGQARDEYKKASELFTRHNLSPQHIASRIQRANEFAHSSDLERKGMYLLALVSYRKIARERSDVPGSLYARAKVSHLTELLHSRGQDYMEENRWKEAQEIYEQLGELYPENRRYQKLVKLCENWQNLKKLLSEDRWEEAKKILANINPPEGVRVVLDYILNPRGQEIWPWLQDMPWKGWLSQKTARQLKKYRQYLYFRKQGDEELIKHQWSPAIQHYRQAAKVDPEKAGVIEKRLAHVQTILERQIGAHISRSEIEEAKKLTALYKSEFPQAEEKHQALSQAVLARRYENLAAQYEAEGNLVQALENYRRSQQLAPKEIIQARVQFLANKLVAQLVDDASREAGNGRFERSRVLLKRAEKHSVDASPSRKVMLKRTEKIVSEFEKIFQKAEKQRKKSNYRQALSFYNEAGALIPSSLCQQRRDSLLKSIRGDYKKLMDWAELLMEQGNLEAAWEVLMAAKAVDPKSTEAEDLKDKLIKGLNRANR